MSVSRTHGAAGCCAAETVAVFLVSWLAGLGAYAGSLGLFYGETISSGDLYAVCFWSLISFGLAFFALYLPVLFGVRRILHGIRPLWAFPIVAALLGVAPTAAICFFFGGGVYSMLSPEAALFYAMFGVAGVVVGLGYAFIRRHDPAA